VEPVQSRWSVLIGCCSDECYGKFVGYTRMLSTSERTGHLDNAWSAEMQDNNFTGVLINTTELCGADPSGRAV
jgi:hypothetical protein